MLNRLTMNFFRLIYYMFLSIFVIDAVTYASDKKMLKFAIVLNRGANVTVNESEFEPADQGVPQNTPTVINLPTKKPPPSINIEGSSNEPLNIHQHMTKTEEKSLKIPVYRTCRYEVGTESQPRQPLYVKNSDDDYEAEVVIPTMIDGSLKIILLEGDMLSFKCKGEHANEFITITNAFCDSKKGLLLVIRKSGGREESITEERFSDGFTCHDPLIPLVYRDSDYVTFRIGFQIRMPETEEIAASAQSESIETVSLAFIRDDIFTLFSIRAHKNRIVTYHKIKGTAIRARQKFEEDMPPERKDDIWLSKCEKIQELDEILEPDSKITQSKCEKKIKEAKEIFEKAFTNDKEIDYFPLIQLVPHQDMILIRDKYATFYHTNIIPLWHSFHCTWSGLEEMIRHVAAEFETEAIIYTGKDFYHSEQLHRKVYILWKVYYDPKNHAAISFVLFNDPTLTREQIDNENLCPNICETMYWYVGNNDPKTGYIICCDVSDLKAKFEGAKIVNITYNYIPCGDDKDEVKKFASQSELMNTQCEPISDLEAQWKRNINF